MKKITLQTGVWYNDHPIDLTFPESWEIQTFWPDLPDPLSEKEILGSLQNPINCPPLSEQARGCKRPVIVIDDLARPTPVFRVIPYVVEQFQIAGIAAENIRIVVATGTHGHQDEKGLAQKIGSEVYRKCTIIVHDYQKNCRKIGVTSYGTPVIVNKEVLDCDYLCGIGGIYPQHTTGFGGGSKLSLGVLARKSIVHLHFGGHKSVGGTYAIDNSFRHDLDEIARMIGFKNIMTLHTNSQLELVKLTCGDHFIYYEEAARFSRQAYDSPLPVQADVVIANTYPSDVSYTFMRKGFKPLRCAPADSTKIAIGYCHEGVGRHGIFPQGGDSRIERLRALRLRISTMSAKVIVEKIVKNLFRRKKTNQLDHQTNSTGGVSEKLSDFLLYRPVGAESPIPEIGGMHILSSWQDVIQEIQKQHSTKEKVRVCIYPCSSLQCLDHTQLNSMKSK